LAWTHSESSTVRVGSETGRLRRVIVTPPGPALGRMLPAHIEPSSSSYLLFDDLVHVPGAAREHDALCRVLESAAEVGMFHKMLAKVLEDPTARQFTIEETARLTGLDDKNAQALEQLDGLTLARSLIVGTLGGKVDDPDLFPPVPNLLFTRDLAAVVGDLVIVGNASKPARRRETVLTWAVIDHHPWFEGARIAKHCRWVRDSGGSYPLTIEGGDVMVASNETVLIGASERTTWSRIVQLSQELLAQGFERVLVVEMPKQRSSMHLDTVFTFTEPSRAVCYAPLLEQGNPEEATVIAIRASGAELVFEDLPGSLIDALATVGHTLDVTLCGGGHPIHGRREQWTDGANYVALAPGIAIGYGRNVHTANAMKEAGYTVIDPKGYLALLDREADGDIQRLVDDQRKIAIHIEGSELSRGRGGPRCLTFPVQRDA